MTSATSVTGTPAAAMRWAVEPVETICTPAAWSPVASSSRPVLSYTEIRARFRGTVSRTVVVGWAEVTRGRSFEGVRVSSSIGRAA